MSTTERLLLMVFVLPFLTVLLATFKDLIQRASPRHDFSQDYGVNEWMINYAGGFTRRGLPGELLHRLHEGSGLHPNPPVVVVSVLIYLLFCLLVWKASRCLIPAWGLLTTPLMAAPLYLGTIVRKDVLGLLVLFVALQLLRSSLPRAARLLLVNVLAIAALLSHELFGFYALLPLGLVLAAERLASAANLAPALGVFLITLVRHGTPQQASAIHLSWKSAWLGATPWPDQPGGSIMWLGISARDGFTMTVRQLLERHFGIPLWWILIATALSGAVLVAALFLRNGHRAQAKAMLLLAPVQFLVLLPVFLHGVDFGRWIMTGLLSLFLLVISCEPLCRLLDERTPGWRPDRLAPRLWRPGSAAGLALPGALLLWGNCAVSWSLPAALFSSPLVSMYAALRQLGVFGSAGLLHHLS